jgi:Uma2 family endonuclease
MSTAVAELPDLYEVINGQIVEQTMSARTSAQASELAYALSAFGKSRRLGKAYTEVLIAMPDRFEHNRRPDVIFVSSQTWPMDRLPPDDAAWAIVPDLCVEVVSPNDSAHDLRGKINEYFDAGVPMVWVVYPNVEQVEVFTSPKQSRILDRNDTLTGGSILPEFELPLQELFLRG